MTQKMKHKAVVLVSGGLDSATCLAWAINEGYEVHALSFDYGQRHKTELKSARKICRYFKVKNHQIFKLNLRTFGGSALTADIEVPKNRSLKKIGREGIPVTYVPARNTIFLSLALAYAETVKAFNLVIGVNALDYSGYPDCRPEFIRAFEKLANLATKEGVEGKKFKIHTPLLKLTKAEIIKKGVKFGVDYSLTSSCYSPVKDKPCGHCDSCLLRLKGFKEAGYLDPLRY